MRAPGVLAFQRFLERLLRVDPVRVDAQAGVLAREALALARKTHLGANGVEQIGGVAAIDHGESGIQPHVLGVVPQQAVTNGMEGACPDEPLRQRAGLAAQLVVEGIAHDFIRAALHLDGGAARESEHQDARRIDAAHGQVRHAVRQRVGLAGTRARDDQQRPRTETLPAGKCFSVGHRPPLRSVETA